MNDWMKPSEMAEKLGVGHIKVLAWIASGKLKAVNVATTETQRPQYRIMNDEAQRFIESRTTSQAKE